MNSVEISRATKVVLVGVKFRLFLRCPFTHVCAALSHILSCWCPVEILSCWCPVEILSCWCPVEILSCWCPVEIVSCWCPVVSDFREAIAKSFSDLREAAGDRRGASAVPTRPAASPSLEHCTRSSAARDAPLSKRQPNNVNSLEHGASFTRRFFP